MGLEFAPLGWIYHDGWRFKESKTLLDYDDQGNPVHIDRSKTCYQKGHCHLFVPGVDPTKSSGQLYWGEQNYSFNIVDEWGPNSTDPIQNKSVRLLGKPVWYFHIDEYWRRMYIQPWDAVDRTCELPCNQAIQYEKHSLESYWSMLIDEWTNEQEASSFDDTTPTDFAPAMALRFPRYFDKIRRKRARALFADSSEAFQEWLESSQDSIPIGGDLDSLILQYLTEEIPIYDDSTGEQIGTRTRMDSFEQWYSVNAGKYEGYVSRKTAMEEFMAMHGITEKAGCKKDIDGYIHVPLDETIGHIGIKWDASKPCHSLGPFREGGEFYFFNTVVNRTMPCEYWLDEGKRTRQYYIRQNWEGFATEDDTAGGQTWTYEGDMEKFVWVQDDFSEAQEILGPVYEEDGYHTQYETYSFHRVPDLHGAGRYNHIYVHCGFNAKRIRTDKSVFQFGRWYGDNSKIVPSPYDETEYQDVMENSQPVQNLGHYDKDLGWVEDDPVAPTRPAESENAVHWEASSEGWTGWYEYDELIRCAKDGAYYVREWKPAAYEIDRFGEDGKQPYWTRKKRQCFPNPPPWLCDGSHDADEQEPSIDESHQDEGGAFCASDPWTNARDNRIHHLYWEYAMYYGFARRYSSEGGWNPSRDEEQEDADTGMKLALDWETRIEDWNEAFGTIESREDEEECFLSWLAALGDRITKYQDRLKYYRPDGTEIDEGLIDLSTGMYLVYQSIFDESENVWEPLPAPSRIVFYHSDGPMMDPLTYVTFEEFCGVWRRLTDEEIDRLNLDGDTPKRNKTAFPKPLSFEEYYGQPENPNDQTEIDNRAFKESTYARWTEAALQAEASPTLIKSDFFPRLDTETRAENESRTSPLPAFRLSPLDEAHLVPTDGSPIDPYRNGTVNPIQKWKSYYSRREIFTIPRSTVAGGDKAIENPKGTPNLPWPHPRETSYSGEDGARRHYPDRLFVTPIIEYQKVTRLNSTATSDGYCRLAGKEADDALLQETWKTSIAPDWGDGFEISVSIPYKINGEVQSPFSDASKKVQPPGAYCHSCVPPENQMRYHVDFYDSFDKIRTFDFPNYVNIIRAFQTTCLPQGAAPGTPSLYDIEDFNDYEKTVENRNVKLKYTDGTPNLPNLVQYNNEHGTAYQSWQEVLDDYWRLIDRQTMFPDDFTKWKYSNTPIIKGMDCEGQETHEDEFVTLDDGTKMWRERTTDLLPSADQLEYVNVNGTNLPGYRDSHGNFIKGGGVVNFSNPFGDDHADGRWVEQCLGAVVKAKCLLILEDALGYRWQQWVDSTAMAPTDPIRGKDYDG